MLQPIYLAQGSPQTDFVFTPSTIFHAVFIFSDHLDQAFHLTFVEFVPPFFRVVLLETLQNLFHSVPIQPQ